MQGQGRSALHALQSPCPTLNRALAPALPPSSPPCSVRDPSCASLKVFQAHAAGLLSIVQAGSRTYSLAADGSINGWSSAVPHPSDLHAL